MQSKVWGNSTLSPGKTETVADKTWEMAMFFRKSLIGVVLLAVAVTMSGCPCGGPGVPAKLSPIENVAGWVVFGDWELTGILSNFTDDPDDLWQFQGSLKFPTTGYSMAAPEITVSESNPEQVTVRLLVIPPAPGDAVESKKQELKFTLEFDVSEDATFDFQVVTACNGQEGGCGGTGTLAEKFSLSSVPGYLVQGNNFLGFLIYDPFSEVWSLQGSFVFLTGGHTAEVVGVESAGNPVTTTTITLSTTPPARGSNSGQFIQTIPISVTIENSVSTLFKVIIVTACP